MRSRELRRHTPPHTATLCDHVALHAVFADYFFHWSHRLYDYYLYDYLCVIEGIFNIQLVNGIEVILNGGGSAEMAGGDYLELDCALAWAEVDGPFYP